MTISRSLRFRPLSAAILASLLAASSPAEPPANATAPATVSGKFLGDGKPAAIRFVRVEAEEPFSGKEAIAMIFTEKDPAGAKKPSFDALFGKLGSALILKVHRDGGGIFGCQVAHTAHSKSGFTALGQIKMVEFAIAGGRVTGHVTTGGTLEAFGQKWEVDLKFSAPEPAASPAAKPAPPKSSAREAAPPPREAAPAPPAGPAPSARKLPLPTNARAVEYKALVKQIQFSSDSPVAAVADEFSARLKEQGWKDGPGGVRGPNNAILSRVLGGAKLNIIIQPSGTGSVVKVFADGLDWSGGE